MATSFKDKLEIATNVSIILVLLLIGGSYLRSRTARSDLGPAIGNKIPPLTNYAWQAHPQTLVVAVRKGCIYCERSYPLYRRLNGLENDNQLKAHMVIVMPDDAAAGAALLSSQQISSQSISNLTLTDIKVSATPTLLLVDANGRVLQRWIGELDASKAEALVTQLRR